MHLKGREFPAFFYNKVSIGYNLILIPPLITKPSTGA